jgi:Family of unknown function (DUF5677)
MMDSIKTECLWTEVLAHAEKLLQLVRDSAPTEGFDVSHPNVHIVGMFWRALRLYDGALVLLKAELPEETAILARSLFETSMRLQQLQGERQHRTALILHWLNSSLDHQLAVLEVMKACALDIDIEGKVAMLKAQRKQIRKSVSGLGHIRSKPFLGIKDAAFKFDRKDDYFTFEWTQESVHGTDASWMFAKKRATSEWVGLCGKTDEPMLRSGLAYFAARSMADATMGVFKILGWALPAGLGQTVSNIKELIDTHSVE